MSKTVERTATIAAPPAAVFAYLDDPMRLPDWVPSMRDVHDVAGSEVGKTYRWTYEMGGMTFSGQSRITEYEPDRRMVRESSGTIASVWTYELAEAGGETRLTLRVEYSVPVPVLGRVAESVLLSANEREADLALENLRSHFDASGVRRQPRS